MKKRTATVSLLLAIAAAPSPGFGWGHEGHQVIVLIAEHYMNGDAMAKAGNLLDDSAVDGIASWADDYRRDHPLALYRHTVGRLEN